MLPPALREVYGIRVCVLRLTNTYGPRMRVKDARQTFLGYWLRQIVAGEEIAVFGDGAAAARLHLRRRRGRRLPAGGDPGRGGRRRSTTSATARSCQLLDLAELLVELNGGGSYKVVPFPEDRQSIDIGDYYGDFARIKGDLGWEPHVGLDEGLRRSIDFYRKHGDAYWA